jgi:CheY-like chemotaxis protein
MPEISGFEATSAIRCIEGSRSGGKRSQIVALTGLVSDKDRRAAENAGTDGYITKPAGLKTIKEVIDKWKLGVNKVSPVPDK